MQNTLYKHLKMIWLDLCAILDNEAENPFNLKHIINVPVEQKGIEGRLVYGCEELDFYIRSICNESCITLHIINEFELMVSEVGEITLNPKILKESINSDFIIGIIESFEYQIKNNSENLTKAINNYENSLKHHKEVIEALYNL